MENLFGRKVIYTSCSDLNIDFIVKIVNGAMTRHEENSLQIAYLERYFTGNQPILDRNKIIRPDVNNKIVVNNAYSIVRNVGGYFLGEPIKYASKDAECRENVEVLNNMMDNVDKPTLAESKIIWKKTREAFAVSYDGGETWHGMTAEGNIVAQILTTIGINADWINTGTLKVGGNFNQSGKIELFDISNTLICRIDKDGITVKCKDGRTIKLNAEEGFVGYDTDNSKMYWATEDEFHMRKSIVENEITIAQRLRFIPIQTDTNYGIGIVAMK